MPDQALILLVLVIVAALLFDYINGFHDTANAIATSVSTRALSVRSAIVLAASLNFIGAMAFTKVARTIGTDIITSDKLTQLVVLSGVLGAILWNLITWYYGLPSSSSHAIIGGIMGAGVAHAGVTALKWAGPEEDYPGFDDFSGFGSHCRFSVCNFLFPRTLESIAGRG